MYIYSRHLRVKHREAISTCRGPFGESPDQYRCEQCDDTFSTQDDLIYHSAIHATQNLICPLCQEKFEDVDAVTVHIKSHVNGMWALHVFVVHECYLNTIYLLNESIYYISVYILQKHVYFALIQINFCITA